MNKEEQKIYNREYYQKNKINLRESRRKYRRIYDHKPEIEGKIKQSKKKYQMNNKEKIKNRSKEWLKNHPGYYREKYSYNFGGMRDEVLERDNWSCVDCGMNNEQHIIIFGRRLNIHHKDGNGQSSKKPNNNINNLETLCVRCHGKKHGNKNTKKILKGGNNN